MVEQYPNHMYTDFKPCGRNDGVKKEYLLV